MEIKHFSFSFSGKGAKLRRDESAQEKQERQQKIADAVKTILSCIGEDPEREGLLKTPERYAKALLFFTKGYEQNIRGSYYLIKKVICIFFLTICHRCHQRRCFRGRP